MTVPSPEPAHPRRLPNFFLAGVPKSGSTSLYRYLDQHPDIYMSPIKEPHYFADEVRFANFDEQFQNMAAPTHRTLREFLDGPMTTRCSAGPVENWDDYVRLFHNVRHERAIGEASVCYLWSPTAASNIVKRLPDAKFLIVLRNPIDRAFSQYRHMLSFASRPIPFRQHFEASLTTSTRFSEQFPFLHFGLYAEQLERLFTIVRRESVGIWFYEDYCADAPAMLREIYRFLGIDDQFTPDMSERHMEALIPRSFGGPAGTGLLQQIRRSPAWRHIRRYVPGSAMAGIRSAVFAPKEHLKLSPEDRQLLAGYYRSDVTKLSRLLGRDLSSWV